MTIADGYADLIERIGACSGLPDDLLHVHAGLIILLGAALALRRPLSSWVPLLLVVVAEAGNEILDFAHYGSWRWPDTFSDIVNTIAWPLTIVLVARVRDRNDAAVADISRDDASLEQ